MSATEWARAEPLGSGVRLHISLGGRERQFDLPDLSHPSFLALHQDLGEAFGVTAAPAPPRRRPERRAAPYRVLLDRPLAPEILYGYGDPCVLRTEGVDGRPIYHLFVTSNDAPNSFPILRSTDLITWEPRGAIFPPGRKPSWARDGLDIGDFWAPEVHQVGETFWACFSARDLRGELAIGLAWARHPEGPYTPDAQPILTGGVIDPHIHLDAHLGPILYWKEDRNDLWPGLLAAWLHAAPTVIDRLFTSEAAHNSARLASLLWPWIRTLGPMERFCALQPLIEAATEDFARFRRKVAEAAAPPDLEPAFRTRILGQRVDLAQRRRIDEPVCVLENDAPWEAHLIEGSWVWRTRARYHLFYAGNDFASPRYGLGVATSDHPLGPFRKQAAPLLVSDSAWQGPGHASIAVGPDGRALLFLHAFKPGVVGYKAFRALLTVGLEAEEGGVSVIAPELPSFT